MLLVGGWNVERRGTARDTRTTQNTYLPDTCAPPLEHPHYRGPRARGQTSGRGSSSFSPSNRQLHLPLPHEKSRCAPFEGLDKSSLGPSRHSAQALNEVRVDHEHGGRAHQAKKKRHSRRPRLPTNLRAPNTWLRGWPLPASPRPAHPHLAGLGP